MAEERIAGSEVEKVLSVRAEAQKLKYSKQSVLSWNYMMLKFIGPALVPFVGEKYLERLYDKAEKEAKKHETEDIKKAVEDGKYKQPTNLKIIKQINQFAAPNKCVRLFVK